MMYCSKKELDNTKYLSQEILLTKVTKKQKNPEYSGASVYERNFLFLSFVCDPICL